MRGMGRVKERASRVLHHSAIRADPSTKSASHMHNLYCNACDCIVCLWTFDIWSRNRNMYMYCIVHLLIVMATHKSDIQVQVQNDRK